MLYGTTLRLHGKFFVSEDTESDQRAFLCEFQEYVDAVKPVPVSRKNVNCAFVFKEMPTCFYVFLHCKKKKKSLNRPYARPYKLVRRVTDRVYVIDLDRVRKAVSVERLKFAHFAAAELDDPETVHSTDDPVGAESVPRQELRDWRLPDVLEPQPAEMIHQIFQLQ